MNDKYYNIKKNMVKYGWTAAGIAAPIIGARYLIYHNIKGDTPSEIFAWTAAIITSIPAIPFTGIVGYTIGTFSEIEMNKKRKEKEDKKDLEKIIN